MCVYIYIFVFYIYFNFVHGLGDNILYSLLIVVSYIDYCAMNRNSIASFFMRIAAS